ncbi:MAG TPA: HAD-IA family hydrolase [Arenibacter sp.]|nr:HAD-IA family hydrolase [Arenibacter sp.]
MDIKVDQRTIIVFDLDDTLYNEIEFLKSAYLEIARKLEKDNFLPLYAKMFSLHRSKQDVFNFISEHYKVPKSGLISDYRAHRPIIKLFDGVLTVLENIKRNNGKIGLITDGRTQTQTSKIEALGLLPYLDHITISEELGTEKPHPDNYKIMETTFGAGSYYYIADNLKKDFITPNALGWNTIGVIDNGLNIHSDSYLYMEAKHEPKRYITTINQLKITN